MINKLIIQPDLSKLLEILSSSGHEVRLVGGCVRDSLLNLSIKDIDIATTLLPEQIKALLEVNNLKYLTIGIKHGTITVIINHKTYEITTLRRDENCDGRHATVTYTNNWQEDARRRDFTINAMSYSDKLYDYFEGKKDLSKGIIKFVGEPVERIKEDYLRILRYFRFFSYYSKDLIDQPSLDACAKLASGVTLLSGERIYIEMKKIILAPSAKSLQLMQDFDILSYLIDTPSIITLQHLINLEARFNVEVNFNRRLAALLINNHSKDIEKIIIRWRLSNHEKKYLLKILSTQYELENFYYEKTLKKVIYEQSKEYATDLILLKASLSLSNGLSLDYELLNQSLKLIRTFDNPVFPISGKDIIKFGIKPGIEIKHYLDDIKKHWQDNNYSLSKDQLTNYAKQLINIPHK